MSECVEIIKAMLPNGIYEYNKTSIDEKFYQSVISSYKSYSSDTYQESKKRSASSTIPVDDLLIGFNLSQDDNGYKQFIQNIETYLNSTLNIVFQ